MKLIFERDARKARNNFHKHKTEFNEGKTIFNDSMLLTFHDEEHSDDEERYISIGVSAKRRVLLVVHTEMERNDGIFLIRIISCRRATALERNIYQTGEI